MTGSVDPLTPLVQWAPALIALVGVIIGVFGHVNRASASKQLQATRLAEEIACEEENREYWKRWQAHVEEDLWERLYEERYPHDYPYPWTHRPKRRPIPPPGPPWYITK